METAVIFKCAGFYRCRIKDDKIDIEINVQERPRLGNFKFVGAKKSEEDELKTKIGLAKSTIITENTKRNAVEVIKKYYGDKGFLNTQVRIEEKPDATFANAHSLDFYIDKGNKVRIGDVNFFGNESVSNLTLKHQLKGTKEMSRFTLHPSTLTSPFGTIEEMTPKQYVNNWGILSPTTTRNFFIHISASNYSAVQNSTRKNLMKI